MSCKVVLKNDTVFPPFGDFTEGSTAELCSSCCVRPGTTQSLHTDGDNEVYTPAKTSHQHVLALRQDYAQSQTVRPRTRLSLFLFFKKEK